MTIFPGDAAVFDYRTFRLGRGRQHFRGPKPDLQRPYVAVLGSGPSFGRFVAEPYPLLLQRALQLPVLNLGADQAGPGFFLQDPDLMRVASRAKVCIVQAMSARALSNRLYTVRPRRNMRLHAVSPLLRGLYPEVDFDGFAMVRPLLAALMDRDGDRLAIVETELRNAWVGRMQTLLAAIEAPTVLFWFSERAPDDLRPMDSEAGLMKYPHYVDRAMLDAVRSGAADTLECVTGAGLPQDLTEAGEPRLFTPTGRPILRNDTLPSPEMHAAAAAALAPAVSALLSV